MQSNRIGAVSVCAIVATTVVAFADQAVRADTAGKHRVYVHRMDTREHPDYDRRHVRPPSWDTFGHRTRFACLRGFEIKDGELIHFTEEIEKYTKTHELGDVIWPSYPILFAKNVEALAEEIRKRDLFLFDIWGYVPGSGPGGYWKQFQAPADVLDMFEVKLGERWLGMDVGEQDGRYIGGYTSQMYPASANRFEQYLNFQRHFERMCEELGNKMCTLVSLNFGHHLLKEGLYSVIGAETAQALPNSQVYYAFIRGAGKQYGVPWFGNASVWNRWGWKTYGPEGQRNGPTKGTSLNLLKRLLYSHILYNCVFVGFENSWFEGESLSPIGRMQQTARRWVNQNGDPGVMITPIAVLADFFSGWSFPRHLYTGHTYRVWGNLPYEPGDYLTDGVLDMLYPEYQDASYFHDERGFMTATPYGDSADCLLSDAPNWLLRQYEMIVVGGSLRGGAEIREKLASFAEQGGHVVITAGSLATLPGGLSGIRANHETVRFEAGTKIQVRGNTHEETRGFVLHRLALPQGATVVAKCGQTPAVVEVDCGKGRVTVLASPFGLGTDPATRGAFPNAVDQPLAKPFPLLKHVRAVLDDFFRRQMLFEVSEGLSLISCRKEKGRYTLGICNNSLEERKLEIISHCGPIDSIEEMKLDEAEKGATGYLPEGFENASIGAGGENRIAGGDVRIFSVQVREENVEEIPHIVPGARPLGRWLPLRRTRSIKEEILARPTFFQHFDGVVVEWRYLRSREKNMLRKEAKWLGLQGVAVTVDLSSGVNLYPDLRLIDNSKAEYEVSMAAIEDVILKMAILDARNLIVALHRKPENNFSRENTEAAFVATLKRICQQAATLDIAIHLRGVKGKPRIAFTELLKFIKKVDAENLHLMLSMDAMLSRNVPRDAVEKYLKEGKVAIWLMNGSRVDVQGALWDVHAPIAGRLHHEKVAEYLSLSPDAKLYLDVVYQNQDEEYEDARALDDIARIIKRR